MLTLENHTYFVLISYFLYDISYISAHSKLLFTIKKNTEHCLKQQLNTELLNSAPRLGCRNRNIF